MIGTELNGRYRVLSKLGDGGMGDVYLVEHLQLGRKEALKILRRRLAETPQLVARFRREARAANRVQHPNIVGVYDFGQLPDGRFFLAMEFADGDPIDTVLHKSGPFSVRRALHVLAQLADAAHYAHERGVIHRDLKPQNLVLVEKRGHPDVLKVIDFGVAKIIDPDYADSVGITQRGAVFGTPAYMAPEVFRGSTPDARIDQYAIGCIAMELLTGDPPFVPKPGNVSMRGLMYAHINEPVPLPSSRRGDVIAPELDRIVLRCLDKQPDQRFATCRELADALRAAPGYGEDKTPPRNLLSSLIRIPADSLEAGTDTVTIGTVDPLADTQNPDLAEARRELHAALRALAEAMVDRGVGDVSLSICVAVVSALDRELADLNRELASLDARDAEVEQRIQEREASLRFAIGELGFERAQLADPGTATVDEIDRQVVELEGRLVTMRHELSGQLAASTERGIVLAAALSELEERLARCYGQLAGLIAQLDPGDAALAPLRVRVREAQEQLG